MEVEDRAGLSTSIPFSPAAASTSSSNKTREEDSTNTRGDGDILGQDQWRIYGEVFLKTCASAWTQFRRLLEPFWFVMLCVHSGGLSCTVKKIWTSYHKKPRTYCWMNWRKWSLASTLWILRNGKVVVESSRCGTFWGVCCHYSFLSLCHSLNLLSRDCFNAVAPARTLHKRTVSVLVFLLAVFFKRNYMFTDLSRYFWPCQTFSVLENQDFYTCWHQEAFCWATLMVSRWGFSTIKGNL